MTKCSYIPSGKLKKKTIVFFIFRKTLVLSRLVYPKYSNIQITSDLIEQFIQYRSKPDGLGFQSKIKN